MKKKDKLLVWLLLLVSSFSYGQIKKYNYKRELKGISEKWHSITFSNTIFSKISADYRDIRILGINTENDTIEAPYLIQVSAEKVINKPVNFNRINTSKTQNGYYFTFEIPTSESFNQVLLRFRQQNFDWRITVEGSHNQTDWFTLQENYRILSINNSSTNFHFTKVNFPDSKYRYIRFFVKTNEQPDLINATVFNKQITPGAIRNYPVNSFKTIENKESKRTEIEVALDFYVPINEIYFGVEDTLDYYRNVSIDYLTDSFETENGWKYRYRNLASGTLNSLEKNSFNFGTTKVQKLRIHIDNQDNKPLSISDIKVNGYEIKLIARFTEPAIYHLVYGNRNVNHPNYDIQRFTNKIPDEIPEIQLGKEVIIEKLPVVERKPLFENKYWLWAILLVLIGLMGWFTIKMIVKK